MKSLIKQYYRFQIVFNANIFITQNEDIFAKPIRKRLVYTFEIVYYETVEMCQRNTYRFQRNTYRFRRESLSFEIGFHKTTKNLHTYKSTDINTETQQSHQKPSPTT